MSFRERVRQLYYNRSSKSSEEKKKDAETDVVKKGLGVTQLQMSIQNHLQLLDEQSRQLRMCFDRIKRLEGVNERFIQIIKKLREETFTYCNFDIETRPDYDLVTTKLLCGICGIDVICDLLNSEEKEKNDENKNESNVVHDE